jgi:chromosome segregation protein
MSTPLSIRLSDEVKEEFKSLSEQTGMKQEDFVATLIATFKERQTETDTGSPVFREKQKVDQALAQIQRVVVGFLEIAHNDKEIKVSKAQEQVEQAQDEVAALKDQLKESKVQQEELSQRKKELEEKVTSLEGQAKSLQALQDAWTEKEAFLNARLADLDAEAKEARKLKSELADAAAEVMQQKNLVALAEQKAATDKEALTDIKTRLQNLENALEQSRKDLQNVKDSDNQQLVALTQKHAEEKGSLTTKIDFQAQRIAELETQLVEKKKPSESKQ